MAVAESRLRLHPRRELQHLLGRRAGNRGGAKGTSGDRRWYRRGQIGARYRTVDGSIAASLRFVLFRFFF